MTLENDELNLMLDKTVVISMMDGAKFRGTLKSVGDMVIVLIDVVEMAEHGKWVKPVVSTATFADVISASKSTMHLEERAYLEKVMIYKEHILRIWPWEPKSLNEEELETNY